MRWRKIRKLRGSDQGANTQIIHISEKENRANGGKKIKERKKIQENCPEFEGNESTE